MIEISYKLTDLDAVMDAIDSTKPVALDLETAGFYGNIELVQFYQKGWKGPLLVRKPEVFHLSALLKPLHILAHNVNYEVSTIQTQLGKAFGTPCHYWSPAQFDDTLLLAKLQFWKQEKFTLDQCYVYTLGYDPYEANNLDKKELQKSKWAAEVLSDDQLLYASIDVFHMFDLYDACSKHLLEQYYLLDKLATVNAFKFQTHGLTYSKPRIDKMLTELQEEVDTLACPINVNSWQQVRPYIGEEESDGLSLATFALHGNERADQVNKTRKLKKRIGFLEKYLRLGYNSKIYGKFMFVTKSGRGNCKDQNLQQLPRATKTVFEAPEGFVYVLSDFAQLELRYACAVANEQLMAQMFKEGKDLHSYTADMMGVDRQQAKTCNFNLIYGGSAKMLCSIFIKESGLLQSLNEVEKLKTAWHKLWPTLTAWQAKATADWRAGKAFQTVLGRKMFAKLYTDAMNLPIQGGSADIAKLAMHKMMTEIRAQPELFKSVKLVNFVHDSFKFQAPDDPLVYKPLARIIATAMRDAWIELVAYTAIPDLPMPVDVQVGKNWGEIEYEIETPTYTLNLDIKGNYYDKAA